MVTLASACSSFSWDNYNNSFFNIKTCIILFAQSFKKKKEKKKEWKHNEQGNLVLNPNGFLMR